MYKCLLSEVFLRITHISETILSILTKLCPNVPWVNLFQSYSLVSYLFIKQDQTILTCNSAVASLMLSLDFLELICFRDMCNSQKKLLVGDGDDTGSQLLRHLICLFTLIINIYGLGVGISTIKKITSGRRWGMTTRGLSYKPKLFFSFLLIYKTRPNDFDLQLGSCISDAFSRFSRTYFII
jgi:hypothetical protein